jgi:hypothetical protein
MGTQAALLGPCRKIHVQSYVPLSYLPLVGHPQQLLGVFSKALVQPPILPSAILPSARLSSKQSTPPRTGFRRRLHELSGPQRRF